MRRLLTRLIAAASLLLIGLLATIAYLAFIGIGLDAGRFKPRLEQVLQDQTGRDVQIAGPVQLWVSMRPRLEFADLRFANPNGFQKNAPEDVLASLGSAQLALDIWPLITQRRLHIQALTGRDLKLSLRKLANGQNNWTLTPRTSTKPAEPSQPQSGDEPQASASAGLKLDIARIRIDSAAIDYHDLGSASAKPHFFDLDSLEGSARFGEPAKVLFKGRVEKQFPYELNIAGGDLGLLQHDGGEFPIDATLNFVGSSLQANGKIWRQGNQTRGKLTFGLGTPDLSEIGRLLQVELPKVGATALAGELSLMPGEVQLASLTGAMGRTTLAGDLKLDLKGKRPRVSGSLALPSLDMRPFLKEPGSTPGSTQAATSADSNQTLSEWYADIGQAAFSLQQLYGLDADVALSVERWLSLPGDVRDVALDVRIEQGRLSAPVSAVVEGVILKGEVLADAGAVPPSFDLALETRESPLGGLGRLLFGLPTVRGNLGSFHLRVSAAGKQVSELVNAMEVQLAISRADLSYGNAVAVSSLSAAPASKPVQFRLEWLTLAIPSGQALRANTTGTLLGQPLEADLSGDTMPNMMRGKARLNMHASSRSVRVALGGVLDEQGQASDIAFSVDAARASDAARWLNLQPRADTALHLSGKARWSRKHWAINSGLIRIGRTEVRSNASHAGSLKANIAIDTLDPKDIESLMPPAKAEKSGEKGDEKRADRGSGGAATGNFVLDIPILPTGIDISDTDIEVTVKRVADSPLQLADLRFAASVRKGQMLASPFAVRVLGTPFSGAVSLDLRTQSPAGEVWISAGDVDAGAMLASLKLVDGLNAKIGALRIHAKLKGSRLGDLLSGSELIGEIERGSVILRDPNTQAKTEIRIASGELRSIRDAPLQLSLNGALAEYPLLLKLTTGRISELLATTQRVPFALDANSLDNQLQINGTLSRNIADRDVELALKLRGSKLQTLSGLARTALPSWGPYAIDGQLNVSRKGYELNKLLLTVGSSQLSGRGTLDTSQKPPRLDVNLAARNIQIDDFPLGELMQNKNVAAANGELLAADASFDAEKLRAQAIAASNQAQKLLSREVLSRQNVALTVRVDQVLSGKDRLGNGRLQAKIEGGRADVGPVEVDIPGGSARWSLGFEPSGNAVAINTRLQVEQFDYGIIARRAKPDANLRGRVSVDLDLQAVAPSLAQAMQYGNGKLDFAIWPESLQSGIIDMWAANLLIALAEQADPSKSSKINCAIGRFTLTDGVLRERQILLDTTRVRIEGTGGASFRDEQLSLYFRPTPKQAQFFSLATPIAVSGSFTKPQFGAAPGAILETVVRLGTSLVWVPLQKMFGQETPADGADACLPAAAGKP